MNVWTFASHPSNLAVSQDQVAHCDLLPLPALDGETLKRRCNHRLPHDLPLGAAEVALMRDVCGWLSDQTKIVSWYIMVHWLKTESYMPESLEQACGACSGWALVAVIHGVFFSGLKIQHVRHPTHNLSSYLGLFPKQFQDLLKDAISRFTQTHVVKPKSGMKISLDKFSELWKPIPQILRVWKTCDTCIHFGEYRGITIRPNCKSHVGTEVSQDFHARKSALRKPGT